ncbi:MAG: MBL fold metallo-hydrolase [bacterium]|nr:MBL fold metallo-hydrolase [bacterium]
MSYTIQTITTPYFSATVNCYLIRTEKGFILVDTGGVKHRAKIEQALIEAGCTPQNLRLIALTHGHFDHADNARYFRGRFGAKIALHSGDMEMVKRGNMFITKGKLMQGFINSMMWLMGIRHFDTFTPDIILKDGDNLREYGFDADVIYLPGHSKGSVGFLTGDGDFIIGDVFTNLKGNTKINGLIDDKAELLASAEKVKASHATCVYVGHGKPFMLPI